MAGWEVLVKNLIFETKISQVEKFQVIRRSVVITGFVKSTEVDSWSREEVKFSRGEGLRKLGSWAGLFTWMLSRHCRTGMERVEWDANVFSEEQMSESQKWKWWRWENVIWASKEEDRKKSWKQQSGRRSSRTCYCERTAKKQYPQRRESQVSLSFGSKRSKLRYFLNK